MRRTGQRAADRASSLRPELLLGFQVGGFRSGGQLRMQTPPGQGDRGRWRKADLPQRGVLQGIVSRASFQGIMCTSVIRKRSGAAGPGSKATFVRLPAISGLERLRTWRVRRRQLVPRWQLAPHHAPVDAPLVPTDRQDPPLVRSVARRGLERLPVAPTVARPCPLEQRVERPVLAPQLARQMLARLAAPLAQRFRRDASSSVRARP